VIELDKPRLVVRIGFAGARVVPDCDKLAMRLSVVYSHIAEVVAAGATASSKFYGPGALALRLTTGLAEGGDLIAAKWFRIAKIPAASAVVREAAAVLPFNRNIFRSNLDAASQPLFDEEIVACGKRVVELDGRYLPDDSPPTGKTAGFCRHVRTRAYRGQAALLLRQCDLLLAAYDPTAVPKPAGTVETIRNALELGIPVVIIQIGSEAGPDDVAVLRHGDGFHEYYPAPTQTWREVLAELLEQIIVPPPVRAAARAKLHALPADGTDDSMALVHDYFGAGPQFGWSARVRQKSWGWFEGYFKSPLGHHEVAQVGVSVPASAPSPPLSLTASGAVKPYRERAAELARQYNGVYRGTFFLNYALAWVAIVLAILALRLGLTDKWHAIEWFFCLLALGELGILAWIFISAREANHQDFNGKGIDYRYLAERLRAQSFLTMAGSGRPPTPATIRHAARADRLIVVEWLLQAIVRHGEFATAQGSIDPENSLIELKSRWLDVQVRHHEENATKMDRMHHFMEKGASLLGISVLFIVALDIAISFSLWFGWMPKAAVKPMHEVLTWCLLPLTALLPAAVSSLNGVRFQSECDRLAERSKLMAQLLKELSNAAQKLIERITHAKRCPIDDEGAWMEECALFAESCARVMADEVADWSVVYSKSVFEI
jgi:hypothetical protein